MINKILLKYKVVILLFFLNCKLFGTIFSSEIKLFIKKITKMWLWSIMRVEILCIFPCLNWFDL